MNPSYSSFLSFCLISLSLWNSNPSMFFYVLRYYLYLSLYLCSYLVSVPMKTEVFLSMRPILLQNLIIFCLISFSLAPMFLLIIDICCFSKKICCPNLSLNSSNILT